MSVHIWILSGALDSASIGAVDLYRAEEVEVDSAGLEESNWTKES